MQARFLPGRVLLPFLGSRFTNYEFSVAGPGGSAV
jgi:hypothetical protein